MKIKNKNYKAELAAYKEKVEKMNLVYVEKEIEYAYGNELFCDKDKIRKLFTSKWRARMGVFFLQSDEECEMVNPYRTYKKTLYEFILYNSVVISCMFPGVIALIILPFILNLLDFEMTYYMFGFAIAASMLMIFMMLIITGKDLYIGIKKYKKQWDEILAKEGIFKPKKYITK